LGDLLSSNAVNDHFTQAVGMGIKHVSVILFSLQLFYRLSEPSGILRKHFQWQESVTNLLHSQLFWLRFVLVAGWFLIKTTQIAGIPVYSDNLGRLAVNINVLALTFFLTELLHPKRGLIQYIPQATSATWLFKLRYLYFVIALSPLIILGFSVTGYHLSALELLYKLMVTLWLVAVLVVMYEIGLRALTLFNRYLAVKNQQQKRQLAASPDQARNEEHIIDIPSINAQSVNTLNILLVFSIIIGSWFIWHNIFSAFSFLERVELWRNKVTINNQETEQVITLVNLFLAGVYGFIVLVLVRNLTSIAEILLFRRVTIESGSRYAIQQLSKYLLMTIGFFAITNELGFSWSQVQWLVAALSVGLGFGLQEIFANFVSGIILLFERPIRVGDIVTIGDVTGKVSRIHMRATTLTDFDQKELIVPNKTFITTQLVNWSLSDAITRLVIPVDIAYGTDIELAHKVMMDTVIETPFVLTTPAPSVLLLAFGDSALRFSIYAYVSETAHRLPVTHDLHLRIVNALKEYHIEIPFPQRDIHIRSVVTETQHPNVI
jgi:potassium efflux system protein